MTSQKNLQRFSLILEEALDEFRLEGYETCGPYLYDPEINIFLLPEPNETNHVKDEVVFRHVDFEDIEDYLKENHYEIWCKVVLNV